MSDINAENDVVKEANKEFDKKYLDEYRKGVFALNTIEEIEQALPDPRFDGYPEIIKYLKEYVEMECETILSEIDDSKNSSDLEYLKSELNKYKNMLVFFQAKILSYLEDENKASEATIPDQERKLIYLKSRAGNILFERDLELIPDEEMADMENAFEFLRFGSFSSNEKKFKKLNNNASIKDVCEVKCYQSRIYFYHIEDDIIFVILGQIKKSDVNVRNLEKICSRAELAYPFLRELKTDLKDIAKKEALISEGSVITDRIAQKFGEVKKGRK